MSKKIIRFFVSLLGIVLGLSLASQIFDGAYFATLPPNTMAWLSICIYVLLGLAFGTIGFFIAPSISKFISYVSKFIVKYFSEIPMPEIFLGSIGLIIGLVVAWLISTLTSQLKPPILGTVCSIFIFLICGYVGWGIPTKRIKEINLPKWFKRNDHGFGKTTATPKLLDTSAIIDGRFFDVYDTGIVEGIIIIPQFVLNELQHISDSTDPLKRSRGRRGLDMLERLESSNMVVIYEKDYPEITEVDAKLLKFALERHAMIVTTDYNLNKLASVQGVSVFNVNDLANSLKINVTAGQELVVTVIKEGKEPTQGVAYFDDGTMVVIDGAHHLMGQTVEIIVTSVLQTSAGRMVFAKLKN